jgi:hemoglobin-like flavoprotein
MSDPVADFKQHFERALGGSAYNDAFVTHFYTTFIDKSPEVAAHFHGTNMAQQKTALYDSLLYMAEFPHSERARELIIALGRAHGHRQLNVHPSLYDLWQEALIETASHFDSSFDKAAELSWRVSLAPGIACMKYLFDH